MKQLTLKILGIPQPKQSMRIGKTRGGKTISFQKNEVISEERNIKWDIKSQLPAGFRPFTGAIRINKLHYVFPPLKSFTQQKLLDMEFGLIHKTTKPDLTDNLNKGLFDAMQGIVFLNDSQICEMNNVKKIYGYTPRIEIELEEL